MLDTYLWPQQVDSVTEAVVARRLNEASPRGYRKTLHASDGLLGKGVSQSRISARFSQTMGRLLEEHLHQRLHRGAIVPCSSMGCGWATPAWQISLTISHLLGYRCTVYDAFDNLTKPRI